MNFRRNLLSACLVLLAQFSFACGSTVRTPAMVLSDDVDDFHTHLRWGRTEEAENYLGPEFRAVFHGMNEELGENFQITEYEVKEIEMLARDVARVKVWMQWYRLPDTTVRSETYVETWEYLEEARTWRMTDRVDARTARN